MSFLPAHPTLLDFQRLVRGGNAAIPVLIDEILHRVAASPQEVFIAGVDPTAVRRRAAQLHDRYLSDPALPTSLPLLGVPFAVKDNIDVLGVATTCACPAFAYQPSRSAAVVERLEAAGAIVIGKTNLDQFATGLVGTRSPYGEVRNPFDPAYVSGGSSAGSAAAVALGIVPFALGTDTAGSGRVPAGFCNLVGIKPTPGLVSTRGVFPACRSLDCVSVFSHTVADAWAVMSTMSGPDAQDPYSRAITALPPLARKVRIGLPVPLEFLGDRQAEQAFTEALAILRGQAGFEFAEVPLAPFTEVARLLYDGPWVAERRLALGEFLDTHADRIDPSVLAIVRQADSKSAIETFAAMYRVESGRRMAESVFERVDALLVPTSPTHHTRATIAADPIARNSDFGLYTNFVNLLGLSALALPGPFRANGLPAGVTLIGPAGADHRIAELARAMEPLLHARLGLGASPPAYRTSPLPALVRRTDMQRLAVVGAHLSGMPLNWQLVERQARLVGTARSAPEYRLYALPGGVPAKPGLIRVRDGGCSIEVELWEMPLEHYGGFVASIPAPLGIGTIRLDDGGTVQGFLCEAAAVADAEDITQYGGWRSFQAAGRL